MALFVHPSPERRTAPGLLGRVTLLCVGQAGRWKPVVLEISPWQLCKMPVATAVVQGVSWGPRRGPVPGEASPRPWLTQRPAAEPGHAPGHGAAHSAGQCGLWVLTEHQDLRHVWWEDEAR